MSSLQTRTYRAQVALARVEAWVTAEPLRLVVQPVRVTLATGQSDGDAAHE